MTQIIDRLDQTLAPNNKNTFIIDKLPWFILTAFIIGLIFKNRHWPGSSIIMLACGSFAAIMIIIRLIEGIKSKNYTKALYGISVGFSFTYLVFRIQYWPGGTNILILAIITGLAVTIYLGLNNRKKEFNNLALSLICVGIFIFYLPKSKIFYYVNMSETLNSWEHYNSEYAWRRYGNFLQKEGDEKGAAMAYLKSFKCAARNEDGEVYQELLDDITSE